MNEDIYSSKTFKREFIVFGLVLLACILSAIAVFAEKQNVSYHIKGIIRDSTSGVPIAGATVVTENKKFYSVADEKGMFDVPINRQGVFTLSVTMMGYKTILFKAEAGARDVIISMVPTAESINAIVVKGVKRVGGDIGVVQAMKITNAVVSGVSGKTISNNQDRDAGEVIRRIPGISIINDKFIIARGLSQRYNDVWINNASTPSSEADTRSFSFDIIPAGQIENIMIVKSPSPELPADFSGGFVKISTKDTPEENPFSISYSSGINTSAHFHDFIHNSDGNGPIDINNNAKIWKTKKSRPLPDQRISASFGKSFKLVNNREFTVIGSLNWSLASKSYLNMENSRFGVYNKIEDKPEYLYKYSDNQYLSSNKIGALLNLAYIRRNSRYYFRNIFNKITTSKYTQREGWQNISSLYLQEKFEYDRYTRNSYSGQISGVHDILNGKIDWEAGYSYADRIQPDRRIINREQNDLVGDPYYGKMGIDQNDIERCSTKLHENIGSAGANYSQSLINNKNHDGYLLEVKAGIYGDYRERKYDTKDYYYRFIDSNLPADFKYGDVVNDIMQQKNFGNDKLYLYDDSDNRDNYKGHNTSLNGYAGFGFNLEKIKVYAGARYEYYKMDLISYTRTIGSDTKKKTYTYSRPFPSVNASYSFDEHHLLRAAYGVSTNRPEFREISSSVYYDFDLFSDIKGNPDLKAAYIHNADIRYEWYPSNGEIISIAVFYKHFKNPIETTFLDAGGSYTYTFENANKANLYGIEAEVKKNLGFLGAENLDVSINAAWMKSRVNFSSGSLEHNRPMEGQSPYLINAGLFYKYKKAKLSIAVLYNRIGKRIVGIGKTDVSAGGTIDNNIPDMYELPRNLIDISISKSVGKHIELKLSTKDVLNEYAEFCQFPKYTNEGGKIVSRKEITKKFKPGREFAAGVVVKF